MDMEKYFGTSNLYEILELQSTAEMHESKYAHAIKNGKRSSYFKYDFSRFFIFSQSKLL